MLPLMQLSLSLIGIIFLHGASLDDLSVLTMIQLAQGLHLFLTDSSATVQNSTDLVKVRIFIPILKLTLNLFRW